MCLSQVCMRRNLGQQNCVFRRRKRLIKPQNEDNTEGKRKNSISEGSCVFVAYDTWNDLNTDHIVNKLKLILLNQKYLKVKNLLKLYI